MKIISLILALFVIVQLTQNKLFSQEQSGIIKGTVIELESGEKLPGANIIVTNTLFGASSNSDGEYQITGLETGTYKLECSLIGYKSISITDVHVKEDKPTEITFLLSPTTLEQDEIIVSFEMPKKMPNKNKYNIDPDFTIIVDDSIDPDMIIAVDPSVDPGIFLNSINPTMGAKSSNDTLNIRILDSIKDKSKSKKEKEH